MYSTTTTFSNLCSDIFLEIFSFLTLNEIVDAFEQNLPSLWTLIDEGHVKIFVDRANLSRLIREKIRPERIFSLTIFNDEIEKFFWPKFSSLRSITLENVVDQGEILPQTFEQIASLKRIRLKFLSKISTEKFVRLSNFQHFEIDSMQKKRSFFPQIASTISSSLVQSFSITTIEINVPLSWISLMNFLRNFPRLKNLRLRLFRIEKSDDNDFFSSIRFLPSFETIETIDFTGYFRRMTWIVEFFCLSMKNLRSCRLMANNVVEDDLFSIVAFPESFFGRHLFHSCSKLRFVKIHMLFAIDLSTREKCQEHFRTFNHDAFCQRFHFDITQRSILNGYVTLTCDYRSKNENFH